MTHEEKIKAVENIFDCFTEFSDEGCFAYIVTPQGAIDISDYDKLISMTNNKFFGLEPAYANDAVSLRCKYDAEGKIRFGIMSDANYQHTPEELSKQLKYITSHLPSALKRLESLDIYEIKKSLSWCAPESNEDIMHWSAPIDDTTFKIFKDDPTKIDPIFRSMGYKWAHSEKSFQDLPNTIITSYQIQFELSKNMSIGGKIKSFSKFIGAAMFDPVEAKARRRQQGLQ